MNLKEKEKITLSLIETFNKAGNLALDLRLKGLKKEIKSDNTPVSNGDLEVNKIITQKILELTPHIPIISEETSDNKSLKDLNNFWLILDKFERPKAGKMALDWKRNCGPRKSSGQFNHFGAIRP